MRTHIFITLVALVISACATRSEVAIQGQNEKVANQYRFADHGSSFR